MSFGTTSNWLLKYPRSTIVDTVSLVRSGPKTFRGSVRPLRLMLWINPGSPRKWSAWRWVMNIARMRMNDIGECISCLCVPSPQSNITTSGPI